MINFFWQLFCAMDLDITNKKREMEEGPDEEFNDIEYEHLCTLQLTLEEEWDKLEVRDALYEDDPCNCDMCMPSTLSDSGIRGHSGEQ